MTNESKEFEESLGPSIPRRLFIPRQSPPKTNDKSERDAEKELRLLQKEKSEHRRDQITRYLLAGCMWLLFIVVFLIIIATVVILAWHFLTPDNDVWQWLDPDQIQVLKNFVLSGAVVGFGTAYLRRYMDGP